MILLLLGPKVTSPFDIRSEGEWFERNWIGVTFIVTFTAKLRINHEYLA